MCPSVHGEGGREGHLSCVQTIDVTLWHLPTILPHITLDLHQKQGYISGLDKCHANMDCLHLA